MCNWFIFILYFFWINSYSYVFINRVWGSRSRKIYASYQFFLYTLFGSFFVLLSILFIYYNKGSSLFDFFLFSSFNEYREFIIWLLLFIGLSVKVPIIPFHIWLPEAHVEAPTPGSVILAGILLKLGTYAMFRFLLINFNIIINDFIFFILMIAIIGFTYSSMVA